jgi:hypothetical protein
MSTTSSEQVFDYSYRGVNTYSWQGAQESSTERIYTATNSVTKGAPVPGWRKLVAEGKNASTSMTGTEWASIIRAGHYVAREESTTPPIGWSQTEQWGCIPFLGRPAFPPTLTTDVANNQALSSFYQHLATTQSKFKGFVFSGELRESLGMILSPAKGLRHGVDKYLNSLKKRGPRMKSADVLRMIRETWLEYSFGWRPFISDIDSAIDAFYKSKAVQPIFEMVKGSGSEEWANTRINHVYGLNLGATWWLKYDLRETEATYIRYYGIYRHSGNGNANSHSYGFAPWEFVPSIYELIPYSFLVDYFTNIGNIVSSWSYRFMGMDWTARGTKSVFTQETVNLKPYNVPWSEDPVRHIYTFTGDVGSAYVRKKVISRDPSVELGIPNLEFKLPGFTSQWVNILALASKMAETRKALRK